MDGFVDFVARSAAEDPEIRARLEAIQQEAIADRLRGLGYID
jgi:hypothetical protein